MENEHAIIEGTKEYCSLCHKGGVRLKQTYLTIHVAYESCQLKKNFVVKTSQILVTGAKAAGAQVSSTVSLWLKCESAGGNEMAT